jgi:ADP-heptose:LPS heptosyltransferase
VRALVALDRVVGRAVCAALTLGYRPTAPRSVTSEQVRRLLVIRPGGLGDAIHLLPLLRALRAHFPRAELDLLMERRNAGLVPPSVARRVLLYDRPRELWTAVRGRYDVVIDTEQWYYLSAIVAFLTRAPIRCGFATNSRARLFTHPVPYDGEGYEARVFLALFETLTGTPAPLEEHAMALELGAAERRAPLGEAPVAVLAPAAPIAERQWDPARWVEVGRRLAGTGYAIVLVGGPEDRAVCGAVTSGIGGARVFDLSGRATIGETAAVIARAALYVASDGGLLHVAHALRVPTVGLFGAGIATKWGPRGTRARIIRHPLPCSPCTRFGYTPPCPIGVECLQRIGVDEVGAAITAVAGEVARGQAG